MIKQKNNKLIALALALIVLAFIIKDYVIPGMMYLVQGDSASSVYGYVSALLQFLVYLLCYRVFHHFELREEEKTADQAELSYNNEVKGSKAVECLVLFAIGVLSYIAFQLLKNVVLLFLFGATRSPIWIPEDITPVSPTALVLIFFVHVVCSAIAEEAFFRATVFHALSKHAPLGGLLYSSFLFSFAHSGIEPVVQSFFLGLVLGVLYKKRQSIAFCAFIHIIYNTLGLINTYVFTPIYGITSPYLPGITSLDCYKEAVGISIVAVIVLYGIFALFGAIKSNRTQEPTEKASFLEKLVAILLLLIYGGKCALILLSAF